MFTFRKYLLTRTETSKQKDNYQNIARCIACRCDHLFNSVILDIIKSSQFDFVWFTAFYQALFTCSEYIQGFEMPADKNANIDYSLQALL